MNVLLDGKELDWQTTGLLDRGFHEWFNEEGGLSVGEHVLEFRLGIPANVTAPIRQLCSVSLAEFGGEDTYKYDNSYIGAFPTFDLYNRKTYRPTNEGCLMRNMSSTVFCPVCIEGLWQNLLSKISLIDSLTATCDGATGTTTLSLVVLPLAHFRTANVIRVPGERYIVRWTRNGRHVPEWDDKFEVAVEKGLEGVWAVDVKFETPEVRVDTNKVLKSSKKIKVGTC
ncbi:hypothetical protein BDK51DRAFT_26001 [Blyttiomyces helicus]|uniref:Uncharacterized protein n=1 Tax=Blyttiomyces helicus TaxID=388810 RepID=A0A4P9WPU2_9FUNG|nr:hypothetical protein BDK51DRAFT_26001 [Blyttiomyces helicus]|eukprot:RKO93778.1 hypothetical protein BDK51DRAFT_26001 [Blyttiomyces helicus]